MEQSTNKSDEQLREEGYILVSRKSYESKENNHDWKYGQVVLGQAITPKECRNCGKKRF